MVKSGIRTRLIYGGSFNPLHIGHMRLAIESLHFLQSLVTGLEFLPVGHPPHKDATKLLPFAIRTEMIKKSIARFPKFSCNELESCKESSSFTYVTMQNLGKPEELYFLLGSQDFALLPTWFNGLKLPEVCNLVIVPREAYSAGQFVKLCRELWPQAPLKAITLSSPHDGVGDIFSLGITPRTSVYYLPLPYLDISASRIRNLWLHGINLDFLIPRAVQKILNREKEVAISCWRENNTPCSR